MQNKITSLTNQKIKEVVKLKESSERKKLGLIIVEGNREIKRALEAGLVLKELFVCRVFLKKNEQKEFFKKISSSIRF